MSHCQHRAVLELLADRSLDQLVSPTLPSRVRHVTSVVPNSRIVHIGRGLVDHQDATLLQNRPRQAHELLLAHARNPATLVHGRLQASRHLLAHQSLELHLLERVPDLRVGILAELVEVAAHGACEQHRILWDDGDATAKIVETESGDVNAVDDDATVNESAHAEESLDERALACARPTDDADLLSRSDGQGEITKGEESV